MLRFKNIIIVFFCLIFFSGCYIKDTVNSGSDEDTLKKRIMTYYNYRINEKFEKSYECEDPLYVKAVALPRYIKAVSAREVKAAKIEGLRIEGEKASADLTLRVKVRLVNQVGMAAKEIEHDTSIQETWIKSDGQWYHAIAAKAETEKKGGNQQ